MTVYEVVLIIAGIVCICISFFVSRKSTDDTGEESGAGNTSASVWTEKDEERIRERVNELLEEWQSTLIEDTQDRMNRLCNEKIMAVDDFSKQILEKIDSNHQEVVFMYNMLNEKEKEIKKIMAEKIKPEPAPAKESPAGRTAEEPRQIPAAKASRKGAEARRSETGSGAKKEKEPAPARRTTATEAAPKRPTGTEQVQSDRKEENVNLQIQQMYKEGKSILEISKALNIGQGEVKLVIALYGGRKR